MSKYTYFTENKTGNLGVVLEEVPCTYEDSVGFKVGVIGKGIEEVSESHVRNAETRYPITHEEKLLADLADTYEEHAEAERTFRSLGVRLAGLERLVETPITETAKTNTDADLSTG